MSSEGTGNLLRSGRGAALCSSGGSRRLVSRLSTSPCQPPTGRPASGADRGSSSVSAPKISPAWDLQKYVVPPVPAAPPRSRSVSRVHPSRGRRSHPASLTAPCEVVDAINASATRRLSSRYLPPNSGHPSPRLIGKSINDRTTGMARSKRNDLGETREQGFLDNPAVNAGHGAAHTPDVPTQVARTGFHNASKRPSLGTARTG